MDLISGDGVYSGVMTSYPARGRYTVTVRVAGDDETTVPRIGALADGPVGSAVTFADQLEPTGTFTRTVRGPVIHMESLPDAASIRPGKITDLTIEIGENGRLYSTWHSAGGDYGSGSVTGFRFFYAADISNLVSGSPSSLVNVDRLTAAGSKASQDLTFPYYDTDYYIGLVAVDVDGNEGPMSNLVHVFLPAPAELAAASQDLELESGPNFSLLSSEKDWIMVGVICGILLVLIIISIVSISYFCCVSRKSPVDRKVTAGGSISDVNVVSSGSSDHTDGTDAGSFDSDMKNLSGNNIIVQGYEARDLEFGLPRYPVHHGGLETPSKDGNSVRGTPVYWSASQLLSKLEEGSGGSYSPHHHHHDYSYQYGPPPSTHHGLEVAPADYVSGERAVSIPDEFCVTVSNLPQQYVDRISAADSFRYSNRRVAGERMPPPPLYPKPKNITQV